MVSHPGLSTHSHSRMKNTPCAQLLVFPPDDSKTSLIFALEQLLGVLPRVIVSGIPTVPRAVISKEKDKVGGGSVRVGEGGCGDGSRCAR